MIEQHASDTGPEAPTQSQAGSVAISIIIPNYNYEQYIARAIDSVLAQDFDDYELIVVDDGSTDGSWDVISSYGGRIQAIKGANMGAGRACLKAAATVRGRYIYILDSDDELRPGALRKIAACFAGSPAKVHFPLQPIDSCGAEIGAPFPSFADGYSRADMLAEVARNGAYRTPPTSGNVYRADVVAAIDDIDYERFLDGVTYLLCPFMGDVITIYEPLALYRVHNRNASGFASLAPGKIALEQSRFIARLDHLRRICTRLGIDASAVPRGEDMSFVAERRIMELIAAEEPIPFSLVTSLWGRLGRSILPINFKIMVSFWAAAILVSPRGARKTLLRWRFNPWSRPAMLRRAIASVS